MDLKAELLLLIERQNQLAAIKAKLELMRELMVTKKISIETASEYLIILKKEGDLIS